jgi:hypothetical protein
MSPIPAKTITQGEASLTREDLDNAELVRHLPGRNRNKADVYVYLLGDEKVAVKDYRPRPWWIRQTLGRLLTRRETQAYRAAAGAAGLPRFLGRIDGFALATAFVEARMLSEFDDASVCATRFDELQTVVAGLHESGVALTDLNHRDILVTASGRIYVIDLAMAWVLGRRPGRWRRALFERFRELDRFSLARLRARFTGVDRSAAIRNADAGTVKLHRLARRIKWRWDRLRGADRVPPVDDHWR